MVLTEEEGEGILVEDPLVGKRQQALQLFNDVVGARIRCRTIWELVLVVEDQKADLVLRYDVSVVVVDELEESASLSFRGVVHVEKVVAVGTEPLRLGKVEAVLCVTLGSSLIEEMLGNAVIVDHRRAVQLFNLFLHVEQFLL